MISPRYGNTPGQAGKDVLITTEKLIGYKYVFLQKLWTNFGALDSKKAFVVFGESLRQSENGESTRRSEEEESTSRSPAVYPTQMTNRYLTRLLLF
jgi:hypothetical protein